MSGEHRIDNIQLAEIMAYAEKPYTDLIHAEEITGYERAAVENLANYVGVTAAKEYLGELSSVVAHYDEGTPYVAPEPTIETHDTIPLKLDQDLGDVLVRYESTGSTVTRTVNALRRQGIYSLRDILVCGQEAIDHTPNIGDRSKELVQKAIEEELDDAVTWKERPRMGDIADLCGDLSEVNIYVLYLQFSPYSRLAYQPKNVQALLDMPVGELVEIIPKISEWNSEKQKRVERPNHKAAGKIKASAQIFANQFHVAKNS